MKGFNQYYIGRYKNGKPRLFKMNWDQWIHITTTLHLDTYETAKDAWDAFRVETEKQLIELPKTKKKLEKDLPIALDKLWVPNE